MWTVTEKTALKKKLRRIWTAAFKCFLLYTCSTEFPLLLSLRQINNTFVPKLLQFVKTKRWQLLSFLCHCFIFVNSVVFFFKVLFPFGILLSSDCRGIRCFSVNWWKSPYQVHVSEPPAVPVRAHPNFHARINNVGFYVMSISLSLSPQ